MSNSESWRNWEGRVVNERFPLRQWLGGSDHSAVFLTELSGGVQKAAIKLISAVSLSEEVQLSRWAAAAKVSHRHILQLFDGGQCVIDGMRVLYVVMEYADENLSQILPVRALSVTEASEMLTPTAEALGFLHRSGLAHGSVKPSNILASNNQLKLSADNIGNTGDPIAREASAYDAPEIAATGISPAADMWSLGATLVAVLMQKQPTLKNGARSEATVPKTIPQPLGEIARECLQEGGQRCTADSILRRLNPPPAAAPQTVEEPAQQRRSIRWFVVAIVMVAMIVAWIGSRVRSRQSTAPGTEAPAAAQPPTAQPALPLPEKHAPAQEDSSRGNVRQRVMPDVSRSAERTIRGRIKVNVQVAVDASGDVSEVRFLSAGTSKYFSAKALEAARRWKFNAPQVDGKPDASMWVLRFQFNRGGVQVFPEQTKP